MYSSSLLFTHGFRHLLFLSTLREAQDVPIIPASQEEDFLRLHTRAAHAVQQILDSGKKTPLYHLCPLFIPVPPGRGAELF